MAGIINNTARQFNLKCVSANGHRVLVRMAPGFNVVDDKHWKAFVDGKKVDPYVAELKKKGHLEFGPKIDDLELEIAPDTKSKSKSEPMAKIQGKLEEAVKQAEIDRAETDTAKAKEREANARAETAELKLAELKAKIAKESKTTKPTTKGGDSTQPDLPK